MWVLNILGITVSIRVRGEFSLQNVLVRQFNEGIRITKEYITLSTLILRLLWNFSPHFRKSESYKALCERCLAKSGPVGCPRINPGNQAHVHEHVQVYLLTGASKIANTVVQSGYACCELCSSLFQRNRNFSPISISWPTHLVLISFVVIHIASDILSEIHVRAAARNINNECKRYSQI